MARAINLGQVVIDQFPVYQTDGYTLRTGETTFVSTLFLDGVASVVPATVVEIGTTGMYRVSFTPEAVGFWRVDVLIDYNKDIFFGEYDVALEVPLAEAFFNAAYDDTTDTLYMEAWLDRGDNSVAAADLVACQIEVYDQAGTLLVTSNPTPPRANGRYSTSEVISLNENRPYNVTVSITDDQGQVVTNHAFTTVD